MRCSQSVGGTAPCTCIAPSPGPRGCHQDRDPYPGNTTTAPSEAQSSNTHVPQSPISTHTSTSAFSAARRPPAVRRPTAGNNVAARVAEYERRMSQDITPTSPTREQPGVAQKKHRSSKSVNLYGLVQRPELFVANPDRADRSSESS